MTAKGTKKPALSEQELRRLYVQAERFRFSDELLRTRTQTNSPLTGAYISVPSLVLCAFAAELYLKCLTALEGNVPLTVHNLKKLYKGLRGKTQNELDAFWAADAPNRAVIAKLAEQIGEKMPDTLWEAIRYGANAFDDLRYAHQQDLSKGKFVLGSWPRQLRQVILQRRPDWINLGPNVGNWPPTD